MIGTILSNRYKIIAELGSGGMAWVYLAEDLVEHSRVAVKVLYPQHSQDLGFLQRFVREARLSMTLSQQTPQRNIVRVIDYGADRDTHYLVMEFVPGQDLGQLLEEQGALPWEKALELARQVAVALERASQNEIVHRDIKPSNIMVTPDGSVRVLDFGIARARTSPELTLSGFVGSPNYAAPEQATGQTVDIRADIYSLGVVLYRMLSGKLPFQADTPWAVVNLHLSTPPPPLKKIRPDVPDQVVHLAQKALAKRPADRFQTPAEMVRAIEAILAGVELPPEVLAVAPRATTLTTEELYERAHQAVEAERWQEAVDLYSQILKIDPDYRDVSLQLSEVGQQIRLASLYRATRRALQGGHWDTALAQLDKIAELAPGYKDSEQLRVKAKKKERLVVESGTPTADFPTQIPTDGYAGGPPPAHGTGLDTPVLLITPPRMVTQRGRGWIGLVILLLALLIAAGSYYFLFAREPSPAPTSTTTPTATVLTTSAPTSTQASTPVLPSPTATMLPPEPTDTPGVISTEASPSPAPTATQTETPTPTVTATIISATRTPALSGQIAFPRFDAARETYDIHVCRVDGSNCRQVAAEASQPDFLPGGTQIVAHSWKTDEKGLVLLSISGQRIWQITDQIEAARPSVDFQGKAYVYHSRQEVDRQPRLYRTYDAETRLIRREGSGVLGLSPSWLPDGRILYGGCLGDTCGIIAMQDDGSSPRQVVAGGTETNPEASPDGRQVAFMSQRDGNWEIYAANIDGSGLRRLTQNPANDGLPAWSPDGRYIAFVSNRNGVWAVWVMGSDGSNQRRLFPIGGSLDGQVAGAAPHEIHGWVEERISWAP